MNKLFLTILVLVLAPCEGNSVNGVGLDSVSKGGVYESRNTVIEGKGGTVQAVRNLFGSAAFVEIPAGSFIMGSSVSEKHRDKDEAQVSVEISRSFEIMSTEVTQKQWFEVMGWNPSYHQRPEDCSNHDKVNKICPDHPVESVSWNDVQIFIKRLNGSIGLKGCDGTPKSARGCYRLPTEAEWEYAVRAGTQTVYFFGEDVLYLRNYAWYKKYNSEQKTHKVGQKRSNPWGLYDVYGNVNEWVQDFYDGLSGNRDSFAEGSKNWSEDKVSYVPRVTRGGSYYNDFSFFRSANRSFNFSNHRFSYVGFRLVRVL